MITLHQIVQEIFKDKRIKELVSKMKPADLQEDLLSHCKMYLYAQAQKNPGKIEELYENDKLFAWFSTVVKREMTGSNSKFYRIYRRDKIVYTDRVETNDIIDLESEISRIKNHLTPAQDAALQCIYQRITLQKTTPSKPFSKGTGKTAAKILALEKKLEHIREIKLLIEAFPSYIEFGMGFVLKYYRGQARFVARNKGKDPDEVLADLANELFTATQQKEQLTKNFNIQQNRIAAKLERDSMTKKEKVAMRKVKKGKRP